MFRRAMQSAETEGVGGAAGRDDARGGEAGFPHAGDGRVQKGLGFRERPVRRIEHEAGERQARTRGDVAGEGDGLGRCHHAGTLAAGVAFHHHVEIAAGDGCGTRQPGDDDGIVGGNRDFRPGEQRAEAADLLLAENVVGDQDVVEPGIGHHLGLADFLAGDAAGAGVALHGGDHGALVGLDVRPVGDARGVAQRLDTGDVALHHVEVDDHGGRAELPRDVGLQGFQGHRLSRGTGLDGIK